MYSGSRSTEGAVSFFSTTPSSVSAVLCALPSKASKPTVLLTRLSVFMIVTDPFGSVAPFP